MRPTGTGRARDLAMARLRVRGSGRADWVEALAQPATGADDGADTDLRESAQRPPAAVWVGLLAALAVIVVLAGGGALMRSWPRADAMATPGAPTGVESVGAEPVGGEPAGAPLEPAGPPVGPAGTAVGASGRPEPAPSPVVHVAGEVRRPGVITLAPGARVADAVQAAGGLRRGGELGAVNLARPVVDGERIEVGAAADPGAAGPGGATASAQSPPAPLDLNTASAEELDSLPGIGPVTAAKILAWRAAHGRFTMVDELVEVPGIGPKTLAEIRPHVRV